MKSIKENHPLDIATQLIRKDDHYLGHTSDHYANMVGPFGGITAATMLNAVLQHTEHIGDPVSLTINYAAPVSNGSFEIKATPARTNRTTQHWFIELFQDDEIVITGTAVFAKRRETWSSTELKFPAVPNPEEAYPISSKGLPSWVRQYDIKIIQGLPSAFSHHVQTEVPSSTTLQWIHDEPKRNIDFLSLTAICDAFFPRIYVRRKQIVPIGTISLTIYFHVDSEQLQTYGDEVVLGHATANQFYNGFFDQTAEIWSPKGDLLATSSQFVYYKE